MFSLFYLLARLFIDSQLNFAVGSLSKFAHQIEPVNVSISVIYICKFRLFDLLMDMQMQRFFGGGKREARFYLWRSLRR